jgi:hypothetical protein
VAEHEKTLQYIQCMLYKLIRHQSDYAKASYWLGVAASMGYSIPDEINNIILNSSFIRPNVDKLLFALDTWTQNK